MKELSFSSLQKKIKSLKSTITKQQMTIDIILDALKGHDHELFKSIDEAFYNTELNEQYLEKAVIKVSNDLYNMKSITEEIK